MAVDRHAAFSVWLLRAEVTLYLSFALFLVNKCAVCRFTCILYLLRSRFVTEFALFFTFCMSYVR